MTKRLEQLNSWLQDTLGYRDYDINPASEDASFRRYYRLEYDNSSRIVMDAPPENEGCGTFIDIATRLRACDVNAPEIFKADLDLGFILLTDLGHDLYLDVLNDTNAEALYGDALTALVTIQQNIDQTEIPPYNESLLLQEMELFREWLLQKHLCIKLDSKKHNELDNLFSLLTVTALEQPKVFVHRDYHSRNLMFCSTNNPGIIDFQDAVIGPLTYDLVSLFKDCYIKWPREKISDWAMDFYRRIDSSGLSEKDFLRWFDLMGVQRQLKASGIFARLYHRDNKASFLKDIPRTLSYILDLEQDYPELKFLTELIRTQMLSVLEKVNSKCA
jgi:aminoglycoside/choline kinase family phosphotransferase